MRLWTVHPRYLDARGLVAVWREALLAQKVLRGATRGYRHHPQLERFRAHEDPAAVIAAYLRSIAIEAAARGYRFDETKIADGRGCGGVEETDGQLRFEWLHLLRKMRTRAPERYRELRRIAIPDPHPLFRIVRGAKRGWEKG